MASFKNRPPDSPGHLTVRFLVFSDDWGRHPSSCQHLIGQLLPDHEVIWVNTIGMRPPRLDAITMRRGIEKLAGWIGGGERDEVRGARREVRERSEGRGTRHEVEASGSKKVASGELLDARGEFRGGSDSSYSRLATGNSESSPRLVPRASFLAPQPSPRVIDAKMWPWMTHRWDRWLNRSLLERQLAQWAEDAIAITTIPIVTDLVGRLPVKKWVYYCVDDFSVWPGLDGKLLGRMEDELVQKVDTTIAVSDTLMESLQRRGCNPMLLTHGVDLKFWRKSEARGARDEVRGKRNESRGTSCENHSAPDQLTSHSPLASSHSSASSPLAPRPSRLPAPSPLAPRPSGLCLFWGVVDRRMNADWVLALADRIGDGKIILAGPQQDPDERLLRHARIELPGPQPFDRLPELAAQAAVLIMPYADLPVTRAMQPLKLKEYLATGKPVVVSELPATRAVKDFLTIARDETEFVDQVLAIVREPVGNTLQTIPGLVEMLAAESWSAKARQMLQWLE